MDKKINESENLHRQISVWRLCRRRVQGSNNCHPEATINENINKAIENVYD
jgi:hypothetical protein